jgi:hypothetical protein
MIGAMRAVDANRPADFSDRDDDRILPGVAEVRLERVEGGVEPLEALREIALRGALVEMGVEAVVGDRRDARSTRGGDEPRGARGGEPHRLDRAAGADHRRRGGFGRFGRDLLGHQRLAERLAKRRIGVIVEVEQALHEIAARGRNAARRCPAQSGCRPSNNRGRDRADSETA